MTPEVTPQVLDNPPAREISDKLYPVPEEILIWEEANIISEEPT